MEMSNVLNKSLEIANKNKYLVRFYEPNNIIYIEKEISYMELGTFLISQNKHIKIIHIYSKEVNNENT